MSSSSGYMPVSCDGYSSEDSSCRVKRSKSMISNSNSNSNHSKEGINKGKDSKKTWSRDEEIIILDALINNSGNTRNQIYDIVRGSLYGEVTKKQFDEKIRTLKRKYNREKDKVNLDLEFSKPKDYKIFKLSQKYWGATEEENNVESEAPSKSFSDIDYLDKYIGAARIDLELIPQEKKAHLRKMYNELKEAALKLSAEYVSFDVELQNAAIQTLANSP